MTGTGRIPLAALSRVDPRRAALFIGFDGVLIGPGDEPDDVRGSRGLGSLVALLEGATRGATVIVSTRPQADLRRYIKPLPQCVLAGHVAESAVTGDVVSRMQAGLDNLAERRPGLTVEQRRAGPDPSYLNPLGMARDLHGLCRGMSLAAPGRPPAAGPGVNAADALATVMQHKALAGRMPILFAGDATADEALGWVLENGGLAVKVGPGLSRASCRLHSPEQARAALSDWLEKAMGPA